MDFKSNVLNWAEGNSAEVLTGILGKKNIFITIFDQKFF